MRPQKVNPPPSRAPPAGRYAITLPPEADREWFQAYCNPLSPLGRMPFAMVVSVHSPLNDQSHSLKRRTLLRLLGAASLILPTVLLSACAQSIPPRQYKRPPSHITAKERKDGGSGCWNLCDTSGRYNR